MATEHRKKKPAKADTSDNDSKNVDWEKRYKDLQAKATKDQQDNASLRDTVMQLSGKVEGMASSRIEKTPAKTRTSMLDTVTEDQLEEFTDSPAKMMKFIKAALDEKTQHIYADVSAELDKTDKAREEAVKSLNTRIQEVDPRALAVAEAVKELKEDPIYAKLDNDVLVAIASRDAEKSADTDDDTDTPNSPPSSRGASRQRDTDDYKDEVEEKAKSFLKDWGLDGDDEPVVEESE